MGQEHRVETLERKTWQLDPDRNGREGYLYYCCICDESLVLSTRFIHPRKLVLVFNETCPGCGFELEHALRCEPFKMPRKASLYANPRCAYPDALVGKDEEFRAEVSRGSSLPHDLRPSITTGIEGFDKTIILKLGQLVALQGEAARSIAFLLCVRATLPEPLGVDSDSVFIDGGNLYDPYTISQYSTDLGLDSAKVQERIHLSRAFTHHQLNSLIVEKLPKAIDTHQARLAIVADITQLYCDPDVREKREAMDLFRKNLSLLCSLAEKKKALVVVSNLQSRNRRMEDELMHSAHISARLEDHGPYTQLTIAKHPLVTTNKAPIPLENQNLGEYL